ncbi:MAG TPA: hypothetical protein VM101_07290 [Flavitalea sp.]|nr:hypothetical protein [Flavitalea sp.]
MIKRFLFATIYFIPLSIPVKAQSILYSRITTHKVDSINVATRWMHLLTDLLRKDSIPPPGCLRIYAYTGLALYESQVPAMAGYQSLFAYFSGNKIPGIDKEKYYAPITANAAIAGIIKKLAILKSAKEIDSLESYYENFFEQHISQEEWDASIAYGRQIADLVFQWSKSDGTFATYSSYSIPQANELWKPDRWSPTPPPGAYQGFLRTFVKEAIAMTLPNPPPAYSTDTVSVFYKNAKAVFEFRNNITISDSLLINAWQNRYGVNHLTMGHLTKLLTLMLEEGNYSLQEASVIYAKNGIAMFDAVVASFNAIYKHNVIRPVTFIRGTIDKNWNTLYNYNFYPSYPSNFASCVAASGTILADAFGESYSITDSIQTSQDGSHQFTSISNFVNTVANCRVIAGIDFPFSIEAGKILGTKIAQLVNALPFKRAN